MAAKNNFTFYALVDCNSFFCSCERLFRPELKRHPVGVLSNNDGCFVSLSSELKSLGVKMGAPYFKVKSICDKNNVAVFSSNFSLYSNLSQRVMTVLSEFTPKMEVYSIDEAFLEVSGVKDLNEYARQIKTTVEKYVGIPVCVGIGRTKTLAKVATYLAKKSSRAKGVVVLSDKKLEDIALRKTPIGQVWGVGRRLEVKMQLLGIQTAKDFCDYKNRLQIQKQFTKVGAQMQDELRGKPRFLLELQSTPKKTIICSRSFGSPVQTLVELKEAVATYTSSAFEKLREQNTTCAQIGVFISTSRFKNIQVYRASKSMRLFSPTADTRRAVKYAFQILQEIYKPEVEYKKAGVYLSDIYPSLGCQMSLLEKADSLESINLMSCIDLINLKEGRDTVKVAACGLSGKAWEMNRNYLSPRYLSGWSQLKKVN